MNTLEKMPPDSSTHIRLHSGNVSNFNLEKNRQGNWLFGFKMKKGYTPSFFHDEDDNLRVYVNVLLQPKGLNSLIDFLNRLREEINE